MNTHLYRTLTVMLIAVAVASSALTGPAAAVASDNDFALTYFPNGDVTTHFGNDWGNARSGGRHHQGTDVFAHKHSSVVAVADGFVTAVGDSDRSGYYVRIAHRDGWESWYMHLNNDTPGTDDGAGGRKYAYAADLQLGMYVPAGTVIGYVGDSGNAEGCSAHTHFELHHDGLTVNPYPYLADAYQHWMRYLDLRDEAR